jgi:hypothetical protein
MSDYPLPWDDDTFVREMAETPVKSQDNITATIFSHYREVDCREDGCAYDTWYTIVGLLDSGKLALIHAEWNALWCCDWSCSVHTNLSVDVCETLDEIVPMLPEDLRAIFPVQAPQETPVQAP